MPILYSYAYPEPTTRYVIGDVNEGQEAVNNKQLQCIVILKDTHANVSWFMH